MATSLKKDSSIEDRSYIMHYKDHFDRLNEKSFQDDPVWLKEVRQNAFEQFKKNGFPNRKVEAWKYTNLKTFEKKEFTAPLTPLTKLTKSVEEILETLAIPKLDCHQILFIDGLFSKIISPELSKIIVVETLSDTIKNNSEYLDTIKKHLGTNAQTTQYGFEALNTALHQDGLFIRIPENCKLDKPIHLINVSTTDYVMTTQKHLIIAEKYSQVTVIESHLNIDSTHYFTNTSSHIILAEGAKLEHIKIQNENENASHIATTDVEQDRHSEFTSHLINLGANIARCDMHVKLNGEGAEATLNGVYITDNQQHMDHYTRIEHLKPHGTSHQFYKGILFDTSRAIFNGQLYVHPGASKTNADQMNKNLLLSDRAEVDTKPQLEIYNDDVKCSHGATVGELDPKQLFYLQSRGIDRKEAIAMLTYAFANDLIEKIKSKPLLNYLKQLISNKLSFKKEVER